jgi:hypothetical protein
LEYEGMFAPRVVREVNTKLKTGLKNPRRKVDITNVHQ